jgi:hypothetical protein
MRVKTSVSRLTSALTNRILTKIISFTSIRCFKSTAMTKLIAHFHLIVICSAQIVTKTTQPNNKYIFCRLPAQASTLIYSTWRIFHSKSQVWVWSSFLQTSSLSLWSSYWSLFRSGTKISSARSWMNSRLQRGILLLKWGTSQKTADLTIFNSRLRCGDGSRLKWRRMDQRCWNQGMAKILMRTKTRLWTYTSP